MNEKIIYPVQPKDINTDAHFFEAFDNMETEISARYIVKLMQDKGEWTSFTEQEIGEFYKKISGYTDGFTFNNLINGEWVLRNEDETLEITPDFVERVHKSSPAESTESADSNPLNQLTSTNHQTLHIIKV